MLDTKNTVKQNHLVNTLIKELQSLTIEENFAQVNSGSGTHAYTSCNTTVDVTGVYSTPGEMRRSQERNSNFWLQKCDLKGAKHSPRRRNRS